MVTAMPERTSDPQVIPYLLYADAGAAMDWLIKTFAFTERVRDKRSDGTVRHGELLLDGGGVIMLGSPGAGFRGPGQLGEVTQVQCMLPRWVARVSRVGLTRSSSYRSLSLLEALCRPGRARMRTC